jgi:hypothetical protein
VDGASASARDRFEAVARSVRDILPQRWILREQTYQREDPKRIYYLSMKFLTGRSLASNVTNLLLNLLTAQAVKREHLDWIVLLEQEPEVVDQQPPQVLRRHAHPAQVYSLPADIRPQPYEFTGELQSRFG